MTTKRASGPPITMDAMGNARNPARARQNAVGFAEREVREASELDARHVALGWERLLAWVASEREMHQRHTPVGTAP